MAIDVRQHIRSHFSKRSKSKKPIKRTKNDNFTSFNTKHVNVASFPQCTASVQRVSYSRCQIFRQKATNNMRNVAQFLFPFVSRSWAERKTERSGPKTDLSGAGAGGRRNGNGLNLLLKIRSTVKPKSILKVISLTVSVNSLAYYFFVVSRIILIIWHYAALWSRYVV